MLFAWIVIILYMEEKVSDVIGLEQERILSQTISWLRFPLIVGVVMLHVDVPFDSQSFPLLSMFKYLLFNYFADLAVPLFFFFSGFLFFYKVTFNFTIYIKKLKKRFLSLVIPYLVWNLLFMLFVFFVQSLLPTLNNRNMINDYSMWDFINSFWNYSGLGYGCPILAPTWFLRDLIVIIIFTPVVYYLIKYTRGIFVVFLSFCYLLGVNCGIVGFPKSWLFFSLGATFSIFGVNFAILLRKYDDFFLSFGLLFVIMMMLFHFVGFHWHYVDKIYLTFGVFAVLSIVARHIGKMPKRYMPLLAESSFFLYLFHGFYITPLSKLYTNYIPINTFSGILGYFIIAFGACVIGIGGYCALKKLVPVFCSFLVGGR